MQYCIRWIDISIIWMKNEIKQKGHLKFEEPARNAELKIKKNNQPYQNQLEEYNKFVVFSKFLMCEIKNEEDTDVYIFKLTKWGNCMNGKL